MDKNMILAFKAGGIFMLACFTLVAFAAIAEGEVKTGQDVLMCLAFLAPNLVLLYWPIKRHIAYLNRTAPERERAREVAREQAENRTVEQKRLREEKAARTQAEREVNAARGEVESFYAANAELLRDVLPPSLFRSELQTSFPAGIGVPDAWSAARDMLALMQPIVNRERERQRKEHERKLQLAEEARKTDDEIRECEERIAHLQAIEADDANFVDDEIPALQKNILRLKQRREMLVNGNG